MSLNLHALLRTSFSRTAIPGSPLLRPNLHCSSIQDNKHVCAVALTHTLSPKRTDSTGVNSRLAASAARRAPAYAGIQSASLARIIFFISNTGGGQQSGPIPTRLRSRDLPFLQRTLNPVRREGKEATAGSSDAWIIWLSQGEPYALDPPRRDPLRPHGASWFRDGRCNR